MAMKKTKSKLTVAEVVEFCREHQYSLRDATYQSLSFWLTPAQQKGSTATVYMCTCGWSSTRHGCPLHG